MRVVPVLQKSLRLGFVQFLSKHAPISATFTADVSLYYQFLGHRTRLPQS